MNFVNSRICLLLISICMSSLYARTTSIPDNPNISGWPIYFRFDKDVFERDYKNNANTLLYIEEVLTIQTLNKNIDSMTIIAFASPEGDSKYNNALALRRAEGIKRYLCLQYPVLNSVAIRTCSKGENWSGLIAEIESSQDIPAKEAALNILREKDTTSKKEKIKSLSNGETWLYIEKHILPELRVGATFFIHFSQKRLNKLQPEPLQIKMQEKPLAVLDFKSDRSLFQGIQKGYVKPLFALKSNLLADMATCINIELEIPIGKQWSIGAEWMFPWWIFDNNKYYNQLLLGTIEGRYWFHRKEQSDVLSGHAIGLYVSGGYYDFQWKKKGYQGEIIPSAGLSYTYAHKMGEHFRMEYSVGFGVLNTKYRKYTANDEYDQFPWLSSGRTLWIGPTKAEISFVWLISKRVRNEK